MLNLANRRAEKIRDTYRVRLCRLESVEKGLRKASRVLAKDMEKTTAEMRKRIEESKKQGEE